MAESISIATFGTFRNREVKRFRLVNGRHMSVDVIDLGATITSIRTVNRNGQLDEVTLWYKDLEGLNEHLSGAKPHHYLGAIVGRCVNRISNAQFVVDGKTFTLSKNCAGQHSIHGGATGIDKEIWAAEVVGNKVVMRHKCPDMLDGYPGEMDISLTYELTDENELILTFSAVCSQPCPINLAAHPYFNLAGSKSADIYDHSIQLFADYFTPNDPASLITTGEIRPVKGTPYDLTSPTALTKDQLHSIHLCGDQYGYDTNFCLRGAPGLKHAAKLKHAKSGRVLDVYTDQPGLQFYTACSTHEAKIVDRFGRNIKQHGALCLETQNYPDSANHLPQFPDCILRPGSEYKHVCKYVFSTE